MFGQVKWWFFDIVCCKSTRNSLRLGNTCECGRNRLHFNCICQVKSHKRHNRTIHKLWMHHLHRKCFSTKDECIYRTRIHSFGFFPFMHINELCELFMFLCRWASQMILSWECCEWIALQWISNAMKSTWLLTTEFLSSVCDVLHMYIVRMIIMRQQKWT